ncbi:type IV pilin [Halomicroarcula sp. GCM10025709]|uniref:type IV pilin n=1 Tax=Haloarcula TaxID=2237 RepID=UPI0024C3964F|nr:type IV pilin [Halomicroarcula sp. YJ-61-S]
MQLKQLFNDDDAVSPVIGVILMVAITVILAAVIASFVLGLGDQTQNATPQASFSFDYQANSNIASNLGTGNVSNTDGNLTITHDGGDSIAADEVYVRGEFDSGASGNWGTNGNWTNAAITSSPGPTSDIRAGNNAKVPVGSAYDIRVIYEAAEGDSSATLGQDTGPDA